MNAADDSLDTLRARVLEAALTAAPVAGWTRTMLAHAGAQAGIPAATLGIIFPEGVNDLLAFYSASLDRVMAQRLAAEPLPTLKIRERIRLGLKARIEAMAPHLEAARRAAALLTLPVYAPLALTLAYRTMDILWRTIGDRSTDFNFYTKRALAAGVYLSTAAVWFRDVTPDKAQTWRYLDRQIDAVMMFEGAKIQLRRVAALLPSPWAVLGALRYPDPPASRPETRAPSPQLGPRHGRRS